jgi:hypothetical protein
MTRRQKIRDIYNDLKGGLRFCELCETKNLSGEIVGYHQGISFSMSWDGRYIYIRDCGLYAVKATQKELDYVLRDVDLNNVVSECEFEKKSGEHFFGWGI